MDKFIVNIIHRPEMVPEYAEKVTGHGKEEDLGRKALLTESLDIFKFQQETAHKNGLKTTIQMTYASLFNDEAVALAKADHEKYGDEIALSLLGLPCTEFREKYKTKDFCIWMPFRGSHSQRTGTITVRHGAQCFLRISCDQGQYHQCQGKGTGEQ